MPAYELHLPPPPGEFRVLYIVFNITRAHAIRAVLRTHGGVVVENLAAKEHDPNYPNVVALVPAELGPDTSGEFIAAVNRRPLSIESEGEAADLVGFVYEALPADGAEEPAKAWVALAEFCPSSSANPAAAPRFREVAGPALDHVLSVEKLLVFLDLHFAQAIKTEKLGFQGFFADLDRRTSSYLLALAADPQLAAQANEVNGWIQAVAPELEDRVNARLAHVGAGAPEFIELTNPWRQACLSALSTWFLDIVRSHFVDAFGEIDLPPFERAFEAFANGALRIEPSPGAWTTQPSSAYYFHFAELAMLAIDNDVEPVTWFRLLNVLVRTQPIFTQTYFPGIGTGGTLARYIACNYPGNGPVPQAEIELAREQHFGLGYLALCAKATENLHAAVA